MTNNYEEREDKMNEMEKDEQKKDRTDRITFFINKLDEALQIIR